MDKTSSAGEPEGSDQQQNTEFTFVVGLNPQGLHSQAMRAHWRRRRKEKERGKAKDVLPKARRLLPSSSQIPTEGTEPQEQLQLIQQRQPTPQEREESSQSYTSTSSDSSMSTSSSGIPSQVLSGMNRALASSRMDPFDMFPVKLTPRHHRLFHHWLSTHATMMFDEMPLVTFNPMRDVWFPLDLSNAASFNAIMAHSAAHLNKMQGLGVSNEALTFKAEALRIITEWMKDPAAALGDDVLAAVVRLLTYERYWGTEAEWRVHREGLERMIEARGGIAALQSNWRLELVTFLISLMSKPSWFDSSNRIWEIVNQPLVDGSHPVLGNTENQHRVRCLWLVSFVQDMRTFMARFPQLTFDGLSRYTALQDSILLLKTSLREDASASLHEGTITDHEFARLACVFFICVLLQEFGSNSDAEPVSDLQHLSELATLDAFLQEERYMWGGSVEGLYSSLFHNFQASPRNAQEKSYVLNMTRVVGSMSSEARSGVAKCLLHILCRKQRNLKELSFDDDWTPDSLLSSLHGL